MLIFETVKRDFIKNKYVYFLSVPVLLYYLIFHYIPLYGAVIAFKNFNPSLGIIRSNWIGIEHFITFFKGMYFQRVVRNTVLISLYSILFAFPVPIIFAILINEIKNMKFKRLVQSVSYMPHFISIIVVAGLIIEFLSREGLVNDIVRMAGGTPKNMLLNPKMFRAIYISSEIWQEAGWGSIIYIAAITSIDQQLYESATIDGAGRFRKIWHITLASIVPTIVILLILRIGRIMNVGYEKVILLYNPMTYETADVISTYVYRKGLLEFNYSFSAAVGLFNSVINYFMLICANFISRKTSESSLW